MTTIPQEHKEDSLSLTPQEMYQLFEITLLNNNVIRGRAGPEVTWGVDFSNRHVWEESFIKVTGEGRNAGDRRIRPTLTIGNPLAVFHVPVAEGHLDGAIVKRYKIKPDLIDANPPVYELTTWYIAQITGLGEVITAQMRSLSDRQESTIPARQFLKPEFPSVSI